MKGIVVDCKTGEIKEIDDGLPEPQYVPAPMPEGLDLEKAAKQLKELETARVEIDNIKEQLKEIHELNLKLAELEKNLDPTK